MPERRAVVGSKVSRNAALSRNASASGFVLKMRVPCFDSASNWLTFPPALKPRPPCGARRAEPPTPTVVVSVIM